MKVEAIPEVLRALAARGVEVWREGHEIRFRAPPDLVDGVERQLGAIRTPLLRHLGATRAEVNRAEVEAALAQDAPEALTAAARLMFDELGSAGTIELKTPMEGRRTWN